MGITKVVGTTLYNFGDQTSIAGLNNAFHRKSYGKKIYWSLLFVGFLVATIYGVYLNLWDYYERDSTTTTDLTYKSSIIFPAIIICNHNK